MRIQFMKDGQRKILGYHESPDADAIALVEIDMVALQALVDRAADNVTGMAKSGPVKVKTLAKRRRWRVTYTPYCRPAHRKVETVEVDAATKFAAVTRGRAHFDKLYRTADIYNVMRNELKAQVLA